MVTWSTRGEEVKTILYACISLCVFLCGCSGKKESGEGVMGKGDGTTNLASAARLPAMNYHALLIGISEYSTDGGWSDLETARADAESIASVLRGKYGFETTLLLDRGATREQILGKLEERLAPLGSDDAFLIYYAGHGYYEESLKEGYWIPSDARLNTNSRLGREKWIWNSTIMKLLSACRARHILVVADACFGGSLFRGEIFEQIENDYHWYEQAIARPSRFLIASGDLEPVLDDGMDHSVFAEQFLHALEYPNQPVFSATDIGVSIREKVSTLTGQHVRMGPLALSAHADGEFVFAETGSGIVWVKSRPLAASPVVTRIEEPSRELDVSTGFTYRGSRERAERLVLSLAETGEHKEEMIRVLAEYIDAGRQEERRTAYRSLLRNVEKRMRRRQTGKTGSEDKLVSARPRILACIGDNSEAEENDSLSTVFRMYLTLLLEKDSRLQIVERESLASLLAEKELSLSNVADSRFKADVCRLLPAGYVLVWNETEFQNNISFFCRLIDVETGRIRAVLETTCKQGSDIRGLCATLADNVAGKLVELAPLRAEVTEWNRNRLWAGMGSFHGARTSTPFLIAQRHPIHQDQPNNFSETVVGKARILKMGEDISEFSATWTMDEPVGDDSRLWLVEATGEE